MHRPAFHPAAEAGAPEPEPVDDRADQDVAQPEPGPEDESASGAEAADGPAGQDDTPIIDPQITWYQSRIAGLQVELAARDEKLREYISAYKQAVSEMDAARERLERDKEKVIDRDRMDLVSRLLDVLDNFDRSISGVKPTTDVAGIRQGLTMVRGQFAQVLQGFGVEPIKALGLTFDAGVHEAAAMVPARGDQADQEVIFEERAGYLYNGKLLRASRVIIATRPD